MYEKRDYDSESKDNKVRKYAYNFDFDVMHPFIMRSFSPFFIRTGETLELGSYRGDFSQRLLKIFDNITCVEASQEAISCARQKPNSDKMKFINQRFEDLGDIGKYENIILTHVLEHLDYPVDILAKIRDDLLDENGRLLLVCPNANAPSRQIAVKMGLISHNSAVSPAELEHGHRCTYTLDTLERDVVAAGLKVLHRSGIFFKALANFQWDQLLKTDIITQDYLEGCYKLGQQYPELCSSIFLVCHK